MGPLLCLVFLNEREGEISSPHHSDTDGTGTFGADPKADWVGDQVWGISPEQSIMLSKPSRGAPGTQTSALLLPNEAHTWTPTAQP